jgi:hypothetical protein
MATIAMAMHELASIRLAKKPLKAEFTLIYISFTIDLQGVATQVRTFEKVKLKTFS